MAKLIISKKQYDLKYTIESWKRLKEVGITPTNFQNKIEDDMAEAMFNLVKFGLSISDRKDVSDDMIETLDFSVMDVISKTIMEGMPESSKNASSQESAETDDEAKK